MSTYLIRNAAIILQDSVVRGRDVTIENGKIEKISPAGHREPKQIREVFDAGGKFLAPGFIDLHFHGLLGYSVNKGPEDLAEITQCLPRFGVTSFLPTLTPSDAGSAVRLLTRFRDIRSRGARILGFLNEGPFLALAGSISGLDAFPPTAGTIREIRDAGSPFRVFFAASPEVPGILDVIPVMAEGRTAVFVTHTKATVEQTIAGIRAGLCHATHFYDVFPCPHEIEPGVRPCGAVEAILSEPDVSVDFILDGEHVHPIAVHMALQCKGPDKVCLVTDASPGAGMPPGRYKGIGGEDISIEYPGGPARITDESASAGFLAGSGLTMDRAVRNAVSMLGVEIPQAVRMAGLNPAAVLGLDGSIGKIREGYDADLVLLNDALEVERTWIGGECRYIRK